MQTRESGVFEVLLVEVWPAKSVQKVSGEACETLFWSCFFSKAFKAFIEAKKTTRESMRMMQSELEVDNFALIPM